MQKAFSLQPDEQKRASQLEEEQRQLLATYGSIEIQRKQIKKRLPQIENEQRTFLRGVVTRVGIDQFTAARIDGNNLIVEIPEQPAFPAPPAGAPNGHAAATE